MISQQCAQFVVNTAESAITHHHHVVARLNGNTNIRRQGIDIVSHDVKQLLTTQEKFCDKLEDVQERTIAHEYRLQTIEQKRGAGATR